MPLFMDRHDVSSEVTAENVAELHQQDLKIQHLYNCRGLTYWFDAGRGTAFCLVEAPDEQSIREMHNKAHGKVPNQIIEVEASIVESFLGRIGDPERSQNTELNIINDPAFRTIMVVALKHSLPLNSIPLSLKSALQHFDHSVLELIDSYEGATVKHSNGSHLVSFKSVSNAVKAAIEIREIFKHFASQMREKQILLKIGLSAGVPVTEKNNLFEDTIKLAERMNDFILGEIILSSEVNQLYNSENENSLDKLPYMNPLTRSEEMFLTLLMDYVETVWDNIHLRANDFNNPLGCSKSKLYRKMKALTGRSPNVFIRDYRLSKALELLTSQSGNVSEIAFETGFSSPSYFSKCFQ
ncbi:MAG: nickel-binding protein, partial [Ginsengibacter sp.]